METLTLIIDKFSAATSWFDLIPLFVAVVIVLTGFLMRRAKQK